MNLLINIDVDDVAAAERFYTTAFDLKVGRRLGREVVEVLGAAAPIYLIQAPTGTAPTPEVARRRDYARHWTPVHLDIVVADVDAAVARAVAAGAVLERPAQSHDWGRIAGLADPWGHGFCLLRFSERGYDALVTPVTGA